MEETTATTWEDSPVAQVFNPDGSQKEGAAEAMAALGHGDFSGTVLRNGAGLFDGFKQHHEARASLTKLQQQKDAPSLAVPTEDSTPDEIKQWRESTGGLMSAQEYADQMWGEDLPDEFQKDESLQELLSTVSEKHGPNVAFVKDLTSGFVEWQGKQQAEAQAQAQQANEELAQKTIQTLTEELGSKAAFDKFSDSARAFLTGDVAKKLGFEFQMVDADGSPKIQAENPLHQAMLSDPSFLRMVKTMAQENNEFKMPDSSPKQASTTDNLKKASEMLQANPNGFKSQADLDHYNQLVGVKV